MPAAVPQVLAAYVQSCLQPGSTTLITSVLDTPSYWLTLSIIRAAIYGVDDDVGAQRPDGSGTPVVFVSFLRPYEYWTELGKKTGLEFSILAATKHFVYIDGLTVGLNVSQPASKLIRPKSHSLTDIGQAIATARSTLSQHATGHLVIDGLDFILASQPDVTPAQLNVFSAEMRGNYTTVVLTASADSPLLHNTEASATPLELDHSIFIRSAAHQSAWVLQLRPLETGHAKDVSGVIQASRGGTDGEDEDTLQDGEWLYQVKGDGNVRVWNRGE